MLGPEVLSVFANSQIFQDHQPTKLIRVSTKSTVNALHFTKDLPTPKESDEDKLIRRLDGKVVLCTKSMIAIYMELFIYSSFVLYLIFDFHLLRRV